ncbi:MAG: peroxiredoxin family protein [Pseudomonadota bacterium]
MKLRHLAIRFLTSATLSLGLACSTALADEWGPTVGADLLDGLTATTTAGDTVSLNELSASGNGLVIAFVRSADWCPFCKKQLIGLSKRQADFEKRGLTLVSISYDSADTLKRFDEQFDIDIALLSDPESKVIDAFDIRNEKQKAGTAGYGIPHPGIMVFNTDGELVLKFAEKSYRDRPDVNDILAAIDARDQGAP